MRTTFLSFRPAHQPPTGTLLPLTFDTASSPDTMAPLCAPQPTGLPRPSSVPLRPPPYPHNHPPGPWASCLCKHIPSPPGSLLPFTTGALPSSAVQLCAPVGLVLGTSCWTVPGMAPTPPPGTDLGHLSGGACSSHGRLCPISAQPRSLAVSSLVTHQPAVTPSLSLSPSVL